MKSPKGDYTNMNPKAMAAFISALILDPASLTKPSSFDSLVDSFVDDLIDMKEMKILGDSTGMIIMDSVEEDVVPKPKKPIDTRSDLVKNATF